MDNYQFTKLYPELVEKLIGWRIEYAFDALSKDNIIQHLDNILIEMPEPPVEIIDLALMTKANDSDFIKRMDELIYWSRYFSTFDVYFSKHQKKKLLSEFIKALKQYDVTKKDILNIYKNFILLAKRCGAWDSPIVWMAIALDEEIDEWDLLSNGMSFDEFLLAIRENTIADAEKLLQVSKEGGWFLSLRGFHPRGKIMKKALLIIMAIVVCLLLFFMVVENTAGIRHNSKMEINNSIYWPFITASIAIIGFGVIITFWKSFTITPRKLLMGFGFLAVSILLLALAVFLGINIKK